MQKESLEGYSADWSRTYSFSDTKPTLVPPQKIFTLPHEKDDLSTYLVPNIELADTWMQRASVSYSFCPWDDLGITKH